MRAQTHATIQANFASTTRIYFEWRAVYTQLQFCGLQLQVHVAREPRLHKVFARKRIVAIEQQYKAFRVTYHNICVPAKSQSLCVLIQTVCVRRSWSEQRLIRFA